jgi:hypothetical protein
MILTERNGAKTSIMLHSLNYRRPDKNNSSEKKYIICLLLKYMISNKSSLRIFAFYSLLFLRDSSSSPVQRISCIGYMSYSSFSS